MASLGGTNNSRTSLFKLLLKFLLAVKNTIYAGMIWNKLQKLYVLYVSQRLFIEM